MKKNARSIWCRVLAGLLSILMVLTLAACAGNENTPAGNEERAPSENTGAAEGENNGNTVEASGEKETLRVMIWGDATLYDQISDALKDDYPEFFNKYDVKMIVGGQGDGEVAEQMRLALASNNSVADVVMLNYTQVPEFAEAGVLEDLSDVYAGYEDNLTHAAKLLSEYKGQTVTVPNQINSKLFYYRKSIFDQCGVDPTKWTTVDEMLADAQKIYDQTGCYIMNCSQEEGFAGCQYDMYLMFDVYDAAFCDENGNYNCASQEGLRKALEMLKKEFDSGLCYGSGDFTSDWQTALAEGKLIGEFTGSWFKLFIPGYAPDQAGDWAACDWPDEIAKGSEAGGSVYVIPTFSEKKEVAKQWLQMYRLENKGVMDSFLTASRTPITLKEFDEINQYGSDYLTNDYWMVEKNSYGDNFTIFNYTPKAMAEQAIMLGWTAQYFAGSIDVDTCLRGMEADMQSQIGNAYD